MFEDFEAQLDEIIRVAEKCPDRYKVSCFEVLASAIAPSSGSVPQGMPALAVDTGTTVNKKSATFLTQYDISDHELSRVFHIDDGTCTIIVRDLKTKTVSQKQQRLALLLGTSGILVGKEALVEKDVLIALCKRYATFNSPNFAAHMKKQRDWFLTKGSGWVLTVPGQEKAAEFIKELAA